MSWWTCYSGSRAPSHLHDYTYGIEASIPLWIPTLIASLAAAFCWRLDLLATRRARAGLCPHCNYDLASLPATNLCPECGKPRQQ